MTRQYEESPGHGTRLLVRARQPGPSGELSRATCLGVARDAVLVAFGVSEYIPGLPELLAGSRTDTTRAERFEALHLLVNVLDKQVQMHPVLHDLGLWNALQSERDVVANQRGVPTLKNAAYDESGGAFPETRHPIEVRAVQR